MSLGGRSESLREQRADALAGEAAAAHLDQHADNPPHHLPEKVRADDADEHQRAVAPRRLTSSTSTCVDFSSGSSSVNARKSPKPVSAAAAARIASRSSGVAHPPDERLGERRPAPGDLIEVAARDGAVPRVEPRRHALGGEHVDVGGQRVVDVADERAPAAAGSRASRCDDLAERVHAGVGPAGAVGLERPAAERAARARGAARPARSARSSESASRCSACRRIRG